MHSGMFHVVREEQSLICAFRKAHFPTYLSNQLRSAHGNDDEYWLLGTNGLVKE